MWGYACCHQVVKNSYCTGKAGEHAAAATQQQMVENLEARQREADARAAADENEEDGQGAKAGTRLTSGMPGKELWGEAAAAQDLDEERLKEAIKVWWDCATLCNVYGIGVECFDKNWGMLCCCFLAFWQHVARLHATHRSSD